MSNEVKDIAIKKSTYYFSNNIINTKNFDSNNMKIDEKSQNYFLFTTLNMRPSKIRNM